MRTHLLRPALIGPALLALLLAPNAVRAADAVVVYEAGTPDAAGIGAQIGGGLAGCGAGCLTLRVPARTPVPARRQAMLQFAAPAGTTIVHATIRLRYRTRQPGVVVRTVGRYGSRWVDGGRLRSPQGTRAAVNAGRGATAVGVVLATEAAVGPRAIRGDGENLVAVDSVALTVRDATPPTVGWLTPLVSGGWARGTLCGTARGTDVGLGVDRLELRVGGAIASQSAPPGLRLQPRPSAFDATLCVDTAALEDAAYGATLAAVDGGPDGNATAIDVGVLRVDNTPPSVAFAPPADSEARLPRLFLDVVDATSGVAEARVTVDGLPVELRDMGTRREFLPAQPLADGLHVVGWTVADRAGNLTTGSATFGVADTTPPMVEPVAPLGTTTADAAVVARVHDAGAGLGPDGVRIAVDGIDMTAQLALAEGTARLTPVRPWSEGEHLVRIVATDRSGNRTQREWTFAIPAPVTPPVPVPAPVAPVPDPPAPFGAESPARSTDEPAPAAADGKSPTAAHLRLRASERAVRAGRTITLHGRLAGRRVARRARIEARVDGSWRPVAIAPVDQRGRFSIPVRLPAAGTYEVRARVGRSASEPIILRAR